MKIRGITGSGRSSVPLPSSCCSGPKYSTTSAGHWLASHGSTVSGGSYRRQPPDLLEHLVGLRQVLAVGSPAARRWGTASSQENRQPHVLQADRVQHLLLDLRVNRRIGLVGRTGARSTAGAPGPRSIRRLIVNEDRPRPHRARRCRTTRSSRHWPRGPPERPGTTGARRWCGSSRESMITRMPRRCACATNSRKSSTEPHSGEDVGVVDLVPSRRRAAELVKEQRHPQTVGPLEDGRGFSVRPLKSPVPSPLLSRKERTSTS